MSTRSATIIRQTTYRGEQADTEELMRFYRHCDGYPECHGIDMAHAVLCADDANTTIEEWLTDFLRHFIPFGLFARHIEFEPSGCEHGDIAFLYVVEGIIDNRYRWGRTKEDKLPITIRVYRHSLDEPYISTELNHEPIFSGTAYEYIERFGNGEN